MAPEEQIFDISGPTHLKSVDWNNANHRRCVLARLVQGVYVREDDRRMNRFGPKSLALPWWHSFHFGLEETLHDTSDHSVIGAVLRLTSKSGHVNVVNSPRYVIAFRGIITTSLVDLPFCCKDILSCIRHLLGILHNGTRFHNALGRVQHRVTVAGGAPNIWLTGHSLGAAIALLAAENMALCGCRLPTYLFNPPFPSALLERTTSNNNSKLRQGIHIASSVVKAGVSIYLQSQQKKKNLEVSEKRDQFSALSDWVPCLFLNPDDPVCSGYIEYFEKRLKMKQLGVEAVGDLATKYTLESFILSDVFHMKSEPRHLIPSAEVIINQSHSPCFKVAHGIQQWWDPNLRPHHVIHQLSNSTTKASQQHQQHATVDR